MFVDSKAFVALGRPVIAFFVKQSRLNRTFEQEKEIILIL